MVGAALSQWPIYWLHFNSQWAAISRTDLIGWVPAWTIRVAFHNRKSPERKETAEDGCLLMLTSLTLAGLGMYSLYCPWSAARPARSLAAQATMPTFAVPVLHEHDPPLFLVEQLQKAFPRGLRTLFG